MAKGGGFFAAVAAVGYCHEPSDVGAGQGGVCLLVAPHIVHLVEDSEHSRCGRV